MTEKIATSFSVGVSRDASSLRLDLNGDANLHSVPALRSALASAGERAIAEHHSEVVVDISKVEFMSSSCFKEFLKWFAQVEAIESQSRYRIKIVHDPTVHWQKRSAPALESFAARLVTVERK